MVNMTDKQFTTSNLYIRIVVVAAQIIQWNLYNTDILGPTKCLLFRCPDLPEGYFGTLTKFLDYIELYTLAGSTVESTVTHDRP